LDVKPPALTLVRTLSPLDPAWFLLWFFILFSFCFDCLLFLFLSGLLAFTELLQRRRAKVTKGMKVFLDRGQRNRKHLPINRLEMVWLRNPTAEAAGARQNSSLSSYPWCKTSACTVLTSLRGSETESTNRS